MAENWGKKFWEMAPGVWDDVNNVGLRNHYFCAVHAARLMVPRGKGLIVNISSAGGLVYIFSVPYGVGKAAVSERNSSCSNCQKLYFQHRKADFEFVQKRLFLVEGTIEQLSNLLAKLRQSCGPVFLKSRVSLSVLFQRQSRNMAYVY